MTASRARILDQPKAAPESRADLTRTCERISCREADLCAGHRVRRRRTRSGFGRCARSPADHLPGSNSPLPRGQADSPWSCRCAVGSFDELSIPRLPLLLGRHSLGSHTANLRADLHYEGAREHQPEGALGCAPTLGLHFDDSRKAAGRSGLVRRALSSCHRRRPIPFVRQRSNCRVLASQCPEWELARLGDVPGN